MKRPRHEACRSRRLIHSLSSSVSMRLSDGEKCQPYPPKAPTANGPLCALTPSPLMMAGARAKASMHG
jgi:hypothetical protein